MYWFAPSLVLLVCVTTCLAQEQPIQMSSDQPETEVPEEASASSPENKPKTQTVLSNSEEKPEVREEILGLPVADKAGQDSEALVVLDGSSWATVLQNPGFTFVKFYAPWCGHCREMQPDWEDLAEHFKENPVPGVSLTVAEVDCTAGMDGSMSICMQESIHGYPTVRLYKDGDLVEEFHFARTFDRMKAFIEEKLFDLSSVEPNSIGVYSLDDLSFQKFIDSQGSSATLVFYHVSWCGHCKELRPVWDDLVIDFLMEESEDIKFAEVNCMEALDVCTEEGVEGFPQIYMYKDGVMEDIFQGDRTVEELTNFVWETVDPSRVSENDLDTMLLMQNLMGGGGDGAGEEEEDLDYEDEEADDEEDYEFEEGEEELGDDEEEDEGEEDEEEEEEEEEEDDAEGEEVTEEELEHIKKMIIDEAEKAGEQVNPDGNKDAGEDDDFDADEDAKLFAEGDTEEKMSDEWLKKMMEMDEKKEEEKKKKIKGTNAKELKDKKKMESSEEKKTEKDKEKKPTIKEEL